MKRFKQPLMITAGHLLFIFGIIGIIMPVIPGAPFLILAAAVYAKSSKEAHDWLVNNRLFGYLIRKYKNMSKRRKIFSMIMILVGIILYWIGIYIYLYMNPGTLPFD